MADVRTAVDSTFSGVSRDVAENAEEDGLSELDSGVTGEAGCGACFAASFSCQNHPIVLENDYRNGSEDIMFCVVDSVMSVSELFCRSETSVGKGPR